MPANNRWESHQDRGDSRGVERMWWAEGRGDICSLELSAHPKALKVGTGVAEKQESPTPEIGGLQATRVQEVGC